MGQQSSDSRIGPDWTSGRGRRSKPHRSGIVPKTTKGERYMGLLLQAHKKPQNRILIGVPMTGLIRSEWAMAR